MDQSVFLPLLDRSITEVAESEFQRLRLRKEPEDVADEVSSALNELAKLRDGYSPDYRDEWVALLYLTWFQPSHICLAKALIDLVTERQGDGRLTARKNASLAVLDFGCGTWATLFGVTWSMTEAIEEGADVTYARVDSYDPCVPMVELGKKLWLQFKDNVKNAPSFGALSRACLEIVHPYYCISEPSYSGWFPRPVQERWLTALHIVYKDPGKDEGRHLKEAKSSLVRVAENFNPDLGLLSCHRNFESQNRLREVSPFEGELSAVTERERVSLPQVTQWRKRIKGELGITKELCENHWYLDNPVLSTWEGAAAQIHLRAQG